MTTNDKPPIVKTGTLSGNMIIEGPYANDCPECGSPKPSPWAYCSPECEVRDLRERIVEVELQTVEAIASWLGDDDTPKSAMLASMVRRGDWRKT